MRHELLRQPYYIGIVRYRGVDYLGKHEPLIDRATFDEVQRLLEAHNFAGEKERIHHHYLKGSIFCGKKNEHKKECRCRLIVCNAKSRSGRIYPYFICIGRQRDPRSCSQKAIRIEASEEMIASYYETVELNQELRLQTEQMILEQITGLREEAGVERQQLVSRQRRALDERAKLLGAHYAGAVPLDLLKSEQERIARELDYIEGRLGALELTFDTVERNLKGALSFVTDLHSAYTAACPRVRRQINQAIFERFLISDEGDVVGELRALFDLLLQASGIAEDGVVKRGRDKGKPRGPATGPRGLSKDALVGRAGLEPATLGLKVPCSTS